MQDGGDPEKVSHVLHMSHIQTLFVIPSLRLIILSSKVDPVPRNIELKLYYMKNMKITSHAPVVPPRRRKMTRPKAAISYDDFVAKLTLQDDTNFVADNFCHLSTLDRN